MTKRGDVPWTGEKEDHPAMTDIVERLVALANSLGGDDEDAIMVGVAEIELLRAALQEVADRYPNMCPEAVRRALEPKP